MDPWGTYLQALLATERAWRHLANGVGMDAFVGHQCLLVLAGRAARSPTAARKACSSATTCAPSPTAAATRLTDPERTSPMANTPIPGAAGDDDTAVVNPFLAGKPV